VNTKFFTLATLLILLIAPLSSLFSTLSTYESYDDKQVGAMTILLENPSRDTIFNQDYVLAKLETKIGDPFSQFIFDQDLKTLSQEYDHVEPIIETRHGEIAITIKLWQRPMIRNILYSGNRKVATSTLQKELGIMAHTLLNREEFNKAFNKLKGYYIKKGYFNAQLEYQLISYSNTNEVDIKIVIHEGQSGHVSRIYFSGLTKKEEKDILSMINTKKYHLFSWITGTGTYHEEVLENDKLIIINYLQNQGYADAQINIQIKESQDGFVHIYINAIKEKLFHFGAITISGNTLFSTKKLKKVFLIQEGSSFSPEKLHETVENIKHLYGKDGYIDTEVHYTIHLEQDHLIYDVSITINEGKQFYIGMIHVLGNVSTNKNVILRESLLVPGAVFDSRKLEATQKRLEAIGYFKSVNVYAVKVREDQQIKENYRDVIIEVGESPTGHFSISFGSSGIKEFFGGFELVENNFNHRGFIQWWRKGISSFRGGGEYANFRIRGGNKQTNYAFSWVNPYFNDSLWRIGFDVNYSNSHFLSKDYHIVSYGGSLFTSYPLTTYWTYGGRINIRNVLIKIQNMESEEAIREKNNSSLVENIEQFLIFDSTDDAFRPHRGLRSVIELGFGRIKHHSQEREKFPYVQTNCFNHFYYPIRSKGTLKMRGELKYICPLGKGKPTLFPISERFFLGGETTVRGYKPYIIGPKFAKKDEKQKIGDPMGGTTSLLFSVEYMQKIIPMLDLFIFFDAGSVSLEKFKIGTFRTSYGIGARIEISGNVPIIAGYGIPINPEKGEENPLFFSIGGQF